MRITCPTCGTSYGINPAALSPEGRIVRCARCKEVWHVTAEPAETAPAGAMDFRNETVPAQDDDHYGNGAPEQTSFEPPAAPPADEQSSPPHIDSPPIAADWQEADTAPPDGKAAEEPDNDRFGNRRHLFGRIGAHARSRRPAWLKWPSGLRPRWMPRISLPVAVAGMAAVSIGLLAGRAEIVRLMPQTAAFFKMVGFGVNLRGLDIVDVKTTIETVDGRPVILIEGSVVGTTRHTVEVPRLRFVLRNARGADIYAWNAVLERPTLNPGEKAWFRSRLASPPAEAQEIVVRFFNRRDVAAGAS
jgi:predicted Zn finger-like uncharacterized protein